jgi:DNA-directed RNA polymerase specialized sigma24 family protein
MLTEKELYNFASAHAKSFYRKHKKHFLGSMYDGKDVIQEALITTHLFYTELRKGTIIITAKAKETEDKKNVIFGMLYQKIVWNLTTILQKCLNDTQIPPDVNEVVEEWETAQQSRRFVSLDNMSEDGLDKVLCTEEDKLPFAFSDIREQCRPSEYNLLYLRFVERRTLRELALQDGKSLQAVDQQIKRILKKLKNRLKKCFF